MNKKISCILVWAACSPLSTAYAADSVSVYGLIDLGLTHYSSALTGTGQATSLTRLDSSIAQSSRLGFRGSEDLGGGNSVFFTLETGFAADTGVLGQNGAIFGRQALVGVRNARLGTLSLGRQYDFMSNLGIGYAMGANSAAGSFAWGLHADAANGAVLNNHVYVGDRTNNSIKYQTNSIGGFTAGVMLGLGEVAGNASAGRTVSGLLSYASGRFSSSAAFTEIRNGTDTGSTRIGGLGASYNFERTKVWGLATRVENTLSTAQARTYEAGATYGLTAAVDLSAAYQFQDRNLGVGSARALIAVLDYKLTRRSDVYLGAVHDRDKGYKAYPVYGGGIQAAGDRQTALRVGLRHRF